MARMCEVGLKLVLILSLFIQGVTIAAGVLSYQAYDFFGITDTNWGYFTFTLSASAISCLLYFILIPMSLRNKNVALPAFRILLLSAIVFQFAIATILSLMLRNQQTNYDQLLQNLESAESQGLTCSSSTALEGLCTNQVTQAR